MVNALLPRLPLVTAIIRTPRHVGQDWAHVRVWPDSPSQGDGRAGLDGRVQRRGLGADDALAADAAALEVDGRHVLHGAVGRDLAGDALRRPGAHVRVSVGLVELVVAC